MKGTDKTQGIPYIRYGGEKFVWIAYYNEALSTIERLERELDEMRNGGILGKENKEAGE